ncbi:MAG: cytochrome B [Burkholderiaceae bacterium]|nr:MAG: cytochrome B [Burkholderiaceae bacterium]TAM01329.1 MAG: cytochrome B [Pusillimonas sp.]
MKRADSAEDLVSSVVVWDIFIRIFHWSLVVAFASAYLSSDAGAIHHWFGYVVIGLISARLIWGVVGTKYARFVNFVPSPARFSAYMKDLQASREPRYLGHNPAGGAMIVMLLFMLGATGGTGWLLTTDMFWGSDIIEGLHAVCANTVLALIGVHLAGVALASWRHRENLVKAMFTGRKRMDE